MSYPNAPKGAKLAFGILMVCIYVGMGLLFILKKELFFNNDTMSYILGAVLCVYGVFRAYRLYRG